MKLSAMSLLTLLALMAHGQMEGMMTLCGRRLSEARELLCYSQNALKKRGDLNEASAESFDQRWEPEEWGWGGRRAALGARWARHKRGLVDECCLKPCHVSELLGYC